MPSPAKSRTAEFLAVAGQFRLGDLVTEQPHPLTRHLSDLAAQDLDFAYKVLHTIDAQALSRFSGHAAEIEQLAGQFRETLNNGHRIFLCGCGATGRLSLVCETLWRLEHKNNGLTEKVVAFMAGGDAALIRSIENFEDHPDFGARQLLELGFGPGDLFIGCTEGGETPFVIGALLAALDVSETPPYFLYCNPDEPLCRAAERAARVIRDDRVRKINLTVGPMALTGSTRMQASTVLMAAIGTALLCCFEPEKIGGMTERLVRWWDRCDTTRMTPLTLRESDCYIQGGRLLYETKDDLAISILTDTTERSPTFSMLPFENSREPADPRSLCYLYMPKAIDSAEAWQALLLRPPRTLEWKENSGIASLTRLLGFDFSRGLSERRLSGGTANSRFVIARENGLLWLRLEALEAVFDISGLSPLSVHLVLKMLLNAHSTLVMGRLGRFDGNIMTFVRPSNNKLIDRAVRYARLLLQRNAVEIPYETAVAACIELLERLPPDASVVNAIVSRFADPLKSVEFIL